MWGRSRGNVRRRRDIFLYERRSRRGCWIRRSSPSSNTPAVITKVSTVTDVLLLYTNCLPTVVSVRSLTFSPCAARCLVKGVLSCIPLNNLGENTSKGSDIVCANSRMPRLRAYCQQTEILSENFTNSVVSKSVNFNRKMPGTRTLIFAKVQRAAIRPSSSRSFSGV